MKFLVFIGLSAVAFAVFSQNISYATCNATCKNGQTERCTEDVAKHVCKCECLDPRDIKTKRQKQMLAKFIQDQEGVDKSQIINLDEVIQKAVEESSQKPDTPVRFKVKVQYKENAPPKEVEYKIQTSR